MSDTNDRSENRIRRPDVIPLPATREAMIAQRKTQRIRTLNDHVEELHLYLYGNEKYERFLDAVYDEDAVEGSLTADNLEAARMIRDAATEGNRDPYIRDKKLATIVKSMGIVLKRYGISRRERAHTVSGETVNSGNNNNE